VEVTVRAATPADRPEIDRLRRLAFAERRAARDGELWAAIDAPGIASSNPATHATSATYLGLIDAVAVAVTDIHRQDLADGGHLAVIDELYVEPGAREVSVGEYLLAAAIDWAAGQGCRGIDALVMPGAREAKNLFERMGLKARTITMHKVL
jgi:GNAT superfamily N-acetyltransferase